MYILKYRHLTWRPKKNTSTNNKNKNGIKCLYRKKQLRIDILPHMQTRARAHTHTVECK
jgi:hypothetical protein